MANQTQMLLWMRMRNFLAYSDLLLLIIRSYMQQRLMVWLTQSKGSKPRTWWNWKPPASSRTLIKIVTSKGCFPKNSCNEFWIFTNDQEYISIRFKLVKWWAQSYLAGIPRIICGFRDDDGVVRMIEEYETLKLHHVAQVSNFMKFIAGCYCCWVWWLWKRQMP